MTAALRLVGLEPAGLGCELALESAAIFLHWLVDWLEFNVPFQHKYGYIREAKFLALISAFDTCFLATAPVDTSYNIVCVCVCVCVCKRAFV